MPEDTGWYHLTTEPLSPQPTNAPAVQGAVRDLRSTGLRTVVGVQWLELVTTNAFLEKD